jgi:hypothetical protein
MTAEPAVSHPSRGPFGTPTIAEVIAVTKAAAVASHQPSSQIDLRDPLVAGMLAWLWPGAGHWYQGRKAKGMLFMACILGTFVFGLVISDGRAVYASWSEDDKRLPYLCQLGAGLPALPALLQTFLVRDGRAPLFGGIMAPPRDLRELNDWYKQLHRYLDLGTVYTMIAGLLNILVVYDALAGPAPLPPDETQKRDEEQSEPVDS